MIVADGDTLEGGAKIVSSKMLITTEKNKRRSGEHNPIELNFSREKD